MSNGHLFRRSLTFPIVLYRESSISHVTDSIFFFLMKDEWDFSLELNSAVLCSSSIISTRKVIFFSFLFLWRVGRLKVNSPGWVQWLKIKTYKIFMTRVWCFQLPSNVATSEYNLPYDNWLRLLKHIFKKKQQWQRKQLGAFTGWRVLSKKSFFF